MAIAAGWHADPSRRHQLRYWDGSAWTDHVSDNGGTATEPLGMDAPPPNPEPAAPAQSGGWMDKMMSAAQSATDQSSKWIDENLNSSSSSTSGSPAPQPANSPPPAASASPPPTASASPPPAASASPPPAASASPPPGGSAPAPDLHDQLRKLASLRDEGILTDDEFAAQKAKLLGS